MPCVRHPLENKTQVCDSTSPVYSLLQLDSMMLHLIRSPRAYFNPFQVYNVMFNHWGSRGTTCTQCVMICCSGCKGCHCSLCAHSEWEQSFLDVALLYHFNSANQHLAMECCWCDHMGYEAPSWKRQQQKFCSFCFLHKIMLGWAHYSHDVCRRLTVPSPIMCSEEWFWYRVISPDRS